MKLTPRQPAPDAFPPGFLWGAATAACQIAAGIELLAPLQRFGLVHVDFATGVRTWKDSAYWYRDVIQANGDNL